MLVLIQPKISVNGDTKNVKKVVVILMKGSISKYQWNLINYIDKFIQAHIYLPKLFHSRYRDQYNSGCWLPHRL